MDNQEQEAVLVYSVEPMKFAGDDGREVDGVQVMFSRLDQDNAPQNGRRRGVAIEKAWLRPGADKQMLDVPGIYHLEYIKVAGRGGKRIEKPGAFHYIAPHEVLPTALAK